MKKHRKIEKTRKAYEKPLLRIVNISGGIQTLGIGCKLVGTSTNNFNTPTSCGVSNGCAQNGS